LSEEYCSTFMALILTNGDVLLANTWLLYPNFERKKKNKELVKEMCIVSLLEWIDYVMPVHVWEYKGC
jgi:hypothetical protein